MAESGRDFLYLNPTLMMESTFSNLQLMAFGRSGEQSEICVEIDEGRLP